MKRLGINDILIILFFLLVIVISILIFSGCISERQRQKICSTCPQKTVTVIQKKDSIIEKLTPYMVEPDSASFWAYLSCDSNNQVLIKQLESWNGKVLKPNYYFKHDTLFMQVKIDSLKIYAKYKEKYSTDSVKEIKYIEVNKLTKWQSWRLISLNILIILLLLYLAYRVIRFYINKYNIFNRQ